MGTSFGDVLFEMLETLVADKCGDHVLMGTHHDADGAIMLVFDVQTDTDTDTDPANPQPVPNDDPPEVHIVRPGERTRSLQSV